MININNISKKIKEARIVKNMTQMNLADQLGVSFQAVSNWERANTIPDIENLQRLCEILDLNLEDLLGKDCSIVKAPNIIEKPEEIDELSEEEIKDMAPILPPSLLEKANLEDKEYSFDTIIALAPFLSVEVLCRYAEKEASNGSLAEVVAFAPYLDEDYLEALVIQFLPKTVDEIVPYAPYLKEDSLINILKKMKSSNFKDFVRIAPYLSKETLNSLIVQNLEEKKDIEQ